MAKLSPEAEAEIGRLTSRIIESDGHPLEIRACLHAAMCWAYEDAVSTCEKMHRADLATPALGCARAIEKRIGDA